MNWEIILLNGAILVLMAVFGFLLKRSIGQIDRRLEHGDVRFKEIVCEINELKEKRGFDREYFSKEYVAKDDFIRDIHALDYKIDQVASDVKRLLVISGREKEHADL